MIRILLISLAAFLLSLPVQAQDLWDPQKLIGGSPESLTADPIGNFYLVKRGVLIKYSASGDSLYSWSDPSKGPITLVDATDPLRILVYHRDFNLIHFLNNRLSPLSEPVSPDALGISQTLTVATSNQGGFWILDGTTRRVSRYDAQLNRVTESAPLELPSMRDPASVRMFEAGSRLCLLIPDREIRVLDMFGNLLRKIPVKVNAACYSGNHLLLTRTDQVSLFASQEIPEEKVLAWEESALLESALFKEYLWIRTPKEVIILSR
jgi:hypothetical protein